MAGTAAEELRDQGWSVLNAGFLIKCKVVASAESPSVHVIVSDLCRCWAYGLVGSTAIAAELSALNPQFECPIETALSTVLSCLTVQQSPSGGNNTKLIDSQTVKTDLQPSAFEILIIKKLGFYQFKWRMRCLEMSPNDAALLINSQAMKAPSPGVSRSSSGGSLGSVSSFGATNQTASGNQSPAGSTPSTTGRGPADIITQQQDHRQHQAEEEERELQRRKEIQDRISEKKEQKSKKRKVDLW